MTLSKALNLCIPLPARGKQWLLCYLRPAPEHAWNDPRGHNGQGFQETDAWDHWLLSPGSKLSPYSPGSRAEVLICPLTPMFCECRMNLRKASKPTLGRSLASWGQAHRRPGLHHTWEGRNLCYHDNSKVLKERGTPGIRRHGTQSAPGAPGSPVHQSCWGLAPHAGQDAMAYSAAASSLRSRAGARLRVRGPPESAHLNRICGTGSGARSACKVGIRHSADFLVPTSLGWLSPGPGR